MGHDEFDPDYDPDFDQTPSEEKKKRAPSRNNRSSAPSEMPFPPRDSEQERFPPIEVPADALSPEALGGVIDAFILREGTDYGAEEVAHETKTRQVRRQLDNGDIKIVFDPNTESVTLMTEAEWRRRTR